MKRPDIPVLTTLRFPAAFAIVLFHYLELTPCPSWVWAGFNAGVSFFYVLSGFILYYNYCDLKDRGFFWVARIARIWPVHLFTLALILILLPWWRQEGHASGPITLPANIFLLHAWLPFQGGVLSYNGVSWSLSVEAFFYLCFPWLLAAMQRHGAAPLLVGSLLLSFAIVLGATIFFPGHAKFVWPFNPATRLFEFVLGMASARGWMGRSLAGGSTAAWSGYELGSLIINGVLVIGLPILIRSLDARTPPAYWLTTEISAVAFSVMLVIFACQAGAISRLLSARAWESSGEVSFSLYMVHQVLLRWINPVAMTSTWDATQFFILYVGGSLVAAAALFHFVETPSRQLVLSAYKRSIAGKSRNG